MKIVTSFFALCLATVAASSSSAFASEIFVRNARGHLTHQQVAEVTGMVKNAVRKMSANTLVRVPADADYILQPSVLHRGDELILRVEKERNGEIISMSEETIASVTSAQRPATAITNTVLADSIYNGYNVAGRAHVDGGTTSATSSSAADADQSMNAAPQPEPRTRRAEDVSTERRSDQTVGQLTSASPRMLDPNRIGQVLLGVGPSFGINMKEDAMMYDLNVAYAADLTEYAVGKIFGDFNFATGSSNTRFINLGFAGEFYPTREYLTFGKPYFAGDIGYAFTRDGLGRVGDGVSLGAAAGFKFQASELNWDVAANYTVLLQQVADETPSVVGLRVAVGF